MTSVKVRIAVAVAEDGSWAAAGGSEPTDEDVAEWARDGLAGGLQIVHFWVTAELPIPEPVEVAGGVEEE